MNTRLSRFVSCTAVALLLMTVVSTSARAQDSYNATTGGGTGLPPGFVSNGFNTTLCTDFYIPMSPFTACVYNDFGVKSTSLSSLTPFTFQGGYFRTDDTFGASVAATGLQFVGTDIANNTFTSDVCAVNLSSFVFCSFTGAGDYTSTEIVSLELVTSGGIDAFGTVGSDAGYYIGDQLSFNASTVNAAPEPATLGLVGTGLIGLIGVARRRRNR